MDTMNNSAIKQTVLRRARFIRAVRPLLSGTVLGSVAIVLALYAIGREVWVAHVLENIPAQAGVLAVARFFEVAFLNTSFAVQALSLVLVFGMLWVARDTARNIHSGLRLA
jgi:hypothetical protein